MVVCAHHAASATTPAPGPSQGWRDTFVVLALLAAATLVGFLLDRYAGYRLAAG